MNGPTDVFEVGVIEELVRILFHPLADLVHADGSNFRQNVSVAVNEDGLEHVGQHVLDLISILLQLFAPEADRKKYLIYNENLSLFLIN